MTGIPDSLCGLRLVSSAYLADRRAVRLPRLSVRTRAVRKAYQRVRRWKRGVGFVTTPSPNVVRVGSVLYAHPKVIEKIRRAVGGT